MALPILRKKQPHIRLQHEHLQHYSKMIENGGLIHPSLTICVKNRCPKGMNAVQTLEQIGNIANRAKVVHLNLYFDYDLNGV